jgi:hypothetical protein
MSEDAKSRLELEEQLVAYLYGEMSVEERDRFLSALEAHPDLKEEMGRLSSLKVRFEELPLPAPPPEAVEKVLSASREALRSARAETAGFSLAEVLAWLIKPQFGLGLAALLVVAVGVYMMHEAEKPKDPASREQVKEEMRPAQPPRTPAPQATAPVSSSRPVGAAEAPPAAGEPAPAEQASRVAPEKAPEAAPTPAPDRGYRERERRLQDDSVVTDEERRKNRESPAEVSGGTPGGLAGRTQGEGRNAEAATASLVRDRRDLSKEAAGPSAGEAGKKGEPTAPQAAADERAAGARKGDLGVARKGWSAKDSGGELDTPTRWELDGAKAGGDQGPRYKSSTYSLDGEADDGAGGGGFVSTNAAGVVQAKTAPADENAQLRADPFFATQPAEERPDRESLEAIPPKAKEEEAKADSWWVGREKSEGTPRETTVADDRSAGKLKEAPQKTQPVLVDSVEPARTDQVASAPPVVSQDNKGDLLGNVQTGYSYMPQNVRLEESRQELAASSGKQEDKKKEKKAEGQAAAAPAEAYGKSTAKPEAPAKAEPDLATKKAEVEKREMADRALEEGAVAGAETEDAKLAAKEQTAQACAKDWGAILDLQRAGKYDEALSKLRQFRRGPCKETYAEETVDITEARIRMGMGEKSKPRKLLERARATPAYQFDADSLLEELNQ